MEKIDVVIAYVDMNDNEWRKTYNSFVLNTNIPNKQINSEIRFRDYGTLKACLRSIEQYMSWINNVYLIVSSESQIPEWINRNTVNIVYHEDIIPKEFLPTFNSNVIELHLHNIKNLSEKFIYFNDDMLLIDTNVIEDYFINNKCVHFMTEAPNIPIRKSDDFYRQKRHNSVVILHEMGYDVDTTKVYYNNHGPLPLLRSKLKELYDKLDVKKHITPFREVCNTSPELFTLYLQYNRKLILLKNSSNRNGSCGWNKDGNYTSSSHKKLKQKLFGTNFIGLNSYCVNDVFRNSNISDMSFVVNEVEKLLIYRFPNVSKYENETNNNSQTIPEAGSERNTSI